jgi:hypothetical protein
MRAVGSQILANHQWIASGVGTVHTKSTQHLRDKLCLLHAELALVSIVSNLDPESNTNVSETLDREVSLKSVVDELCLGFWLATDEQIVDVKGDCNSTMVLVL